MPSQLRFVTGLLVANMSAGVMALTLSACGARAINARLAPNLVSVRGSVFDSLTRTPLSGARIIFSLPDSGAVGAATTTTDVRGAFVLSLPSGTWLMRVEHPRFDSLRVAVPDRRVEVPRQGTHIIAFGTPSARTAMREVCGTNVRNDDIALMGFVRDATARSGLDSANVFAKWVDLTLTPRGVTRSTETRAVRTTGDGWFLICGVPAEAMLLLWAERRGATTGVAVVSSTDVPLRFDFALDATSSQSTDTPNRESDSSGTPLFPMSAGSARYRVLVRDGAGRPLGNARVRLLGRNTSRSDDFGSVTFDSVAGGTQTLEVLSIGYQPERRTIDVPVGRESTDSVVLVSLNAMLDTVRVTANRDRTGFEVRRATRRGQFITAEDVIGEDPVSTTRFLGKRPGLRYTFDRNGVPYIEVNTIDKGCRPLILVDGFPPGSAPAGPGHAALDWIVHPDEIGAIEIYTSPGDVPAEFARFAFGPPCGAVAFWTRDTMGLPKAK